MKLEPPERSYSWTRLTGREKKMNKGAMNEDGDVYMSRKGELEVENARKSKTWLQRETERERLMKQRIGHYSVILFPL